MLDLEFIYENGKFIIRNISDDKKEILNNSLGSDILLVGNRITGKTLYCILEIIRSSIQQNGNRFLYVNVNKDCALNIELVIKRYLYSIEYQNNLSIIDQDKSTVGSVVLKNGSQIEFKSQKQISTSSDTIYDYYHLLQHYNLVVFDDYQLYYNSIGDKILKTVYNMNSKGSKTRFIVSSCLDSINKVLFFADFYNMVKKDPSWHIGTL